MMDFFRYDFDYSWPWTYGHLIAAIVFAYAPLIGVESTMILTPNLLSYALHAFRSTAWLSAAVSALRNRSVTPA